MRKAVKNAVVYVTVSALLTMVGQVGALAAANGARLEGMIVGVDGTPAAGYTVHLIDGAGGVLQQATTDERGIYTFAGIPAGAYGIGIETPDGAMAPVAMPPVRVAAGELVRRDVKLVESSAAEAGRVALADPALGSWWSGLSTGAKVGVIIGIIAVAYGAFEAFDDDDDASPSNPDSPTF